MNKIFGRAGEEAACVYLKRKGYRILATNYIAIGGELDIVAYKRGVLVFAEVKTRSGDYYGTPAESVSEKKIFHLRKAAAAFLHEQSEFGKIPVFLPFGIRIKKKIKRTRNDIIEIYTKKDKFSPYKTNHIKNAF